MIFFCTFQSNLLDGVKIIWCDGGMYVLKMYVLKVDSKKLVQKISVVSYSVDTSRTVETFSQDKCGYLNFFLVVLILLLQLLNYIHYIN